MLALNEGETDALGEMLGLTLGETLALGETLKLAAPMVAHTFTPFVAPVSE